MVRYARWIKILPDHHFGGRVGGVAVRGEPGDPVSRSGSRVRSVENKEVAIFGEIGIERDAEDAVFGAVGSDDVGVDVGKDQKWSRVYLGCAGLDDPDGAEPS